MKNDIRILLKYSGETRLWSVTSLDLKGRTFHLLMDALEYIANHCGQQ